MNVMLISYTQRADANQQNLMDQVAFVARVSNPKNQNNTDTSEKLIQYLIKHKHWSPFEMVNICLEINTTRDIARQILRHKSFAFQEYCVEENQKISLKTKLGRTRKIKIKDLYKRFLNKQYWQKSDKLIKIYDEKSKTFKSAKIKEVFNTGIKPVYKLVLDSCKHNLVAASDHKVFTLDGYKTIGNLNVDTDFVAVNGIKQTIKFKKIKNIEYVGEKQTYDIEVEHETHNYICENIVTHNSQRYSDPTEDLGFCYQEARLQDTKNRQNSIEIVDKYLQFDWFIEQRKVMECAKNVYKWAIDNGIAKEQARAVLPEGLTLSRMYMSGNLRSWITYLSIRCGKETQKEHREVAQSCREVIKTIFPCLDLAIDSLTTKEV